jgi:hypothetical protein
MANTHRNSDPLNEENLHSFYKHVVLPQFGIKDNDITWQPAETLGGDESLHRFSVSERSYALIFEDCQGLGNNEEFITHNILGDKRSYKFVVPISKTSISPSYYGFRLPTPSQYCSNITGTFTLIELH